MAGMLRSNDDSMRMGIFYPSTTGLHVVSRRVVQENPNPFELSYNLDAARICESHGLDYIFLADRWAPYGPTCTEVGFQDPFWYPPALVAAMTSVTSEIGLVTTIHTTYHAPAQVARIGATLDRLSSGRWGINVVTGFSDMELALIGHRKVSHDERYDIAVEFLDLLRSLWAGEDGPFHGEFFDIEGALAGEPPVQDWPLVISAGASEAGQAFAARHADWIFLTGRDADEVGAKLANISRLAREYGRPPDAVSPMLHANIILRDTDAEAEHEGDRIRDLIDVDAAREFMQGLVGGMDTYRRMLGDQDETTALRRIGSRGGGQLLHGSLGTIVEKITKLRAEYRCKGIALSFPHFDLAEIDETLGRLLPALESEGLWESPLRRGWSW